MKRVLSVTGGFAVSAVLTLGMAPVPATAAPAKPAKPTAVQISGGGLTEPLVIKAQDRPDAFQSLMNQVNWLADGQPDAVAPKSGKLGPKYVVVVLIKSAPQQSYDLYPLAAGGPRAFRPEKQPGDKKVAGWFYGRLTMSETLRRSGVPLPEKPDVISGGIGGGELVDAAEETKTAPGVSAFLGELRRLVLLNGAVVLTIALGLAGIALLVRRRA
jgi:hypothetical protein